MASYVGFMVKIKQEELKIMLPTALLEYADKIVESKTFKDRNDLICYALRLYIDKVMQVDELKKEVEIAEKNL